MVVESEFFHKTVEVGWWTDKKEYLRNFHLRDDRVIEDSVPVGFRENDKSLEMEFSTFEGPVFEKVDNIPGLRVVKGDSQLHVNETDGELLIEIRYLKIDKMEQKVRRIRPTIIMFGIMGDTTEANAAKGDHRAMGESADNYLVGHDTQYPPGASGDDDLRAFPFWRIGVWGDQEAMKKVWLP